MDSQLLLTVVLIFVLPSLIPHRTALFLTSLCPVLHHQYLLCPPPLFVHRIMFQNKNINRKENTRGMLGVTAVEGCLTEINVSREPFGFTMYVLC